MNATKIEWTDFSANPLKYRDASGNVVWGCIHASEGCRHCYSETLAKRYGRGGPFTAEIMKGLTPFLDEAELHKMLTAKTIGGVQVSGSRCFVGDMTDIYGPWVPDELLDRLFAVFAGRQDVTWMLLTKRAERMREYFAAEFVDRSYEITCGMLTFAKPTMPKPVHIPRHLTVQLPLKNVWLGVSVENQDTLYRIDHLKDTPAAVRFVSFEPLLEDLGALMLDGIQWAIIGGESGPGARPMHVEWIRSIVAQCKAAETACFVKQLGAKPWCSVGAGIKADHLFEPCGHECECCDDCPSNEGQIDKSDHPEIIRLASKKGGDINEWPLDLRVRQFPEVR